MKELTIEQKAQRYYEAIEKGKQIQNTPYTAHWNVMKEVTEYLLPELAESEDEQIRKRIIQALHGDVLDMEETNRAIAWLEKQAEQKHTDVRTTGYWHVEDIERHPSWSEEDMAMYQGVIETEQYMLEVVNGRKIFDVGNESIKEECAKELNWLNSRFKKLLNIILKI